MKEPLLVLAHLLALGWAGFWTFFYIAESAVWDTPLRFALPWIVLGLILIILALIPRLWEGIGGLLLMATGVLGVVAYSLAGPQQLPLTSRILTTIFFGAPPLVAGALFLMHGRAHPARV